MHGAVLLCLVAAGAELGPEVGKPAPPFALALGVGQKIEIPDWANAVTFELVPSQDKARPGDSLEVAIVTRILPGYHIYGPKEQKPSRTEIHPQPLDGFKFGEPVFPPVVSRELSGLGKYDLYEGPTTFRVPVTVGADASTSGVHKIQVKVNFQICTDIACSPPNVKTLTVDVPGAMKGSPVKPVRPEIFARPKKHTGA